MGRVQASYSFATSWTTPAPVQELADVVLDLEHYPDWWPQVRAVAKLGPDTARVLCRSALPYTLDLVLDAVSRELPVLEVAVSGDLDGWVRWRMTETPEGTHTEFTQEVSVSGALALASYAARPLLRWNHHRMMDACQRGLVSRVS
ncbi:SRPBCC family protein [Nocardioides panacisoli]|uniref:SRPBCC family protein n=1 Tax=Nocardioides panacisoli TaxID=627624 RepID=A0ABP7I458_9ACTN